jgi:acyl-[acyl carrier protein]--UDP-N-acetylglucosamine O-acyltransferase
VVSSIVSHFLTVIRMYIRKCFLSNLTMLAGHLTLCSEHSYLVGTVSRVSAMFVIAEHFFLAVQM